MELFEAGTSSVSDLPVLLGFVDDEIESPSVVFAVSTSSIQDQDLDEDGHSLGNHLCSLDAILFSPFNEITREQHLQWEGELRDFLFCHDLKANINNSNSAIDEGLTVFVISPDSFSRTTTNGNRQSIQSMSIYCQSFTPDNSSSSSSSS